MSGGFASASAFQGVMSCIVPGAAWPLVPLVYPPRPLSPKPAISDEDDLRGRVQRSGVWSQCTSVASSAVSLLLNGYLNRRVNRINPIHTACDRPQYQEGWWLAPKNGWGPKEESSSPDDKKGGKGRARRPSTISPPNAGGEQSPPQEKPPPSLR